MFKQLLDLQVDPLTCRILLCDHMQMTKIYFGHSGRKFPFSLQVTIIDVIKLCYTLPHLHISGMPSNCAIFWPPYLQGLVCWLQVYLHLVNGIAVSGIPSLRSVQLRCSYHQLCACKQSKEKGHPVHDASALQGVLASSAAGHIAFLISLLYVIAHNVFYLMAFCGTPNLSMFIFL